MNGLSFQMSGQASLIASVKSQGIPCIHLWRQAIWACLHCSYGTMSYHDWCIHVSKHSDKGAAHVSFECWACTQNPFKYCRSDEIRNHVHDVHSLFPCEECFKVCCNRAENLQHELVHSNVVVIDD